MELNIHEPKSRGFTIFLRYLHLGLNLIIALQMSKINAVNCSTTMLTIGQPVALILIGVNIIAIAILRCRQNFDRRVFFTGFAINVILAGVAMVVSFGQISEMNSCANNKVLHIFIGIEGFVVIAISIVALLGPFQWALRYCNTPGNFAWGLLFLVFPWTSAFFGGYIAVGILNLFVSLSSLIVNILPFVKGMTKIIRKIIQYTWIGGISLMVISLIIVFAVYLSGRDASTFNDQIAKTLAQTFFPINIVDGLFWIWGLITIQSKGDVVRDGMEPQQRYSKQENDLDTYGQQNQGFGTIR